MKWQSLLLFAEILLVRRVGWRRALGPVGVSGNEQIEGFAVLDTSVMQVKGQLNSMCVLSAWRLEPLQINWGMRSGAGCGEKQEREG